MIRESNSPADEAYLTSLEGSLREKVAERTHGTESEPHALVCYPNCRNCLVFCTLFSMSNLLYDFACRYSMLLCSALIPGYDGTGIRFQGSVTVFSPVSVVL